MGRGSSGIGGGGGAANIEAQNQRRFVTDNYGRQVQVVNDISEVPQGRELWSSGAFSTNNGEHYLVFATINGYNVDPNSLVGLRVSLQDVGAVSNVAGWRSWTRSAQADAYINRYDRIGVRRATQRNVARAKAFSQTLKKYGL